MAAVLAVVTLAGCAAPDRPSTVRTPTGTPGPLASLPTTQFLDPDRGWITPPAAALRAPAERWRIPVRAGQYAVRDHLVVVADGDSVRRLDAATGKPVWQARITGLRLPLAVAVEADVVVLTSTDPTDHGMVVLTGGNGVELWRAPGSPSVGPVVATETLLLVAVGEGTIAIDRSTSKELWRSPVRVRLSGTVLYGVDTARQSWVVLDPATGAIRWRVPYTEDDQVTTTKWLFVVLVPGRESYALTSYSLSTGAQQWRSTGRGRKLTEPRLMTVDETTVVVLDPVMVDFLDVGRGTSLRPDLTGRTPVLVRVAGSAYFAQDIARTLNLCKTPTAASPSTSTAACPTASMPAKYTAVEASGARYLRTGDNVMAMRLPDLGAQWGISVPADNRVLTPIPNGFVLHEARGDTELVVYLGA
ncbi:hypothetical protein Acsp05_23990 [Actinokineospora sp. NBRC 105648]|nr:hypothetical protein Acsp05_23990 [Actinokineospora sp. NBRC 105648]